MNFKPEDPTLFIKKKDTTGTRYIFKHSRIEVIERMRYRDQSGFAIRMEFKNASGQTIQQEVSFRQLSSSPNLAHGLGDALDKGLILPKTTEERHELKRYLLEYVPAVTVEKVAQGGYHKLDGRWIYALPSTVIGSDGEKPVRLDSAMPSRAKKLAKKGDLKAWQDTVARPYADVPQLVFAICFAFSGYLLRFSSVGNAVIHLYGQTSKGKTTILVAASSVIGKVSDSGDQRYIANWYTTENGAAEIYFAHHDLAAILDEIGLLGSDIAKVRQIAAAGAHVLDTGAFKNKAKGSSGATEGSWNCTVLSSGNFSLGKSVEEDHNKRLTAAEVRFLDVPFIFDNKDVLGRRGLPPLIGIESDTCALIHAACRKNYGVAGRDFIKATVKMLNKKGEEHLRKLIKGYIKEFQEFAGVNSKNNVQKRTSMKFGLVYAAGMIAHDQGILSIWSKSCIQKAITACYFAHEYTHGEFDPERALLQIGDFLRHSPKKFVKITSKNTWKSERDYKKFDSKYGFIYELRGETYYLLKKEQFRNLVCKGMFINKVIELLTEEGLLERGNQNKPSKRASWRQDKPRTFYWINARILEEGEE